MPAMACGFESHHRHQTNRGGSAPLFVWSQDRDSNGSGSEWGAGGAPEPRPGLRRSAGRVPPPAPRQKNAATFRFRGLRKSRENCTSAASFFLYRIEPASLGFDSDTGSDLDCSDAPNKQGGPSPPTLFVWSQALSFAQSSFSVACFERL